MSRAVFFPYKSAPNEISCSWQLEGAESEATPGGAIRIVEDITDNRALAIAVSAALDPVVSRQLVPETERARPPTQMMLVVRSPSSRFRTAVPLTETAPGNYAGRFEFLRSEVHGELEANVLLIRTLSSAPHIGFAGHKGAILASGSATTVQLEEPPSPPGGYLDISFEDFGASASELRRAHADQLFAVDTEGEIPKIILNEAPNGFAEIMLSHARRGVPRRIRDATYDTIAVQAWSSLLGIALTSLALALDDEQDRADALSALEEWELRCLTFWAPRLFHEESGPALALERLCDWASRRDRIPQLYERVTLAVQEWAKSNAAFDGLYRLYTNEGI